MGLCRLEVLEARDFGLDWDVAVLGGDMHDCLVTFLGVLLVKEEFEGGVFLVVAALAALRGVVIKRLAPFCVEEALFLCGLEGDFFSGKITTLKSLSLSLDDPESNSMGCVIVWSCMGATSSADGDCEELHDCFLSSPTAVGTTFLR